jgi:ketosteroid isomerase-like protein
MDSFDQAVERYHAALREFVKGDHRPVLEVFSKREDVVLCNPLRPFARGPGEVAGTTKQAASHLADGDCDFERVSTFATPELAYILEVERFRATVDGKEGSGALRVTTVLRREEAGWRVAHRHADAITTPQSIESVLQK